MTAWCVVCRIVEHRRNYSDLSLQKAIDIANAAEMAVLEGQQTHRANEEADINLIRYTKQCQSCGKCGHVSLVCCLR